EHVGGRSRVRRQRQHDLPALVAARGRRPHAATRRHQRGADEVQPPTVLGPPARPHGNLVHLHCAIAYTSSMRRCVVGPMCWETISRLAAPQSATSPTVALPSTRAQTPPAISTSFTNVSFAPFPQV